MGEKEKVSVRELAPGMIFMRAYGFPRVVLEVVAQSDKRCSITFLRSTGVVDEWDYPLDLEVTVFR